jgi:hypothetical protein
MRRSGQYLLLAIARAERVADTRSICCIALLATAARMLGQQR